MLQKWQQHLYDEQYKPLYCIVLYCIVLGIRENGIVMGIMGQIESTVLIWTSQWERL